MKLKYYLILICLTCSVVVNAQYFKKLGIEEGLSSLSVLSIYQDTLGRMWFGTNAGIDVYDGEKIKEYKSYEVEENGQGKTRIFNGAINQIMGNNDGDVFILNNASLIRYDIHKETFHDVRLHNVRAVTVRSGEVWCCISDTLFLYDSKEKRLRFKTRLDVPMVTFLQEMNGKLYVGTRKGLYVLQDDRPVCLLPDVEIFKLFASSRHELWIASRMDGLYKIGRDGVLRKEEVSSSRVISGQIREFAEDEHQNIWFGTFEGLQVYNPYSDTYKVYTPDGRPGSLNHESVFSLYKDRQGTIWLGSYYGGINYFNLDRDVFSYYYAHEEAKGECLNFPVVGQMVEDKRHDLWIATDGGGVNRYNREDGTFTYLQAGRPNSILHDNVKTLAYDEVHDCLYIGTYTGGLSRYDIRSGQFYHYLPLHRAGVPSPGDRIYHCQYREGYLYVSAFNGFWRLDVQTGQFTMIDNRYQFLTFEFDRNGYIWLADSYDLYRMKVADWQLEKKVDVERFMDKKAKVTGIKTAKDGTVYFSTLGDGFFSYSYRGDSVRHYTSRKDGLLSDYCYNLAETPLNHILVMCDKGFSIYSPFNNTVRSVEAAQGKGLISAMVDGNGICVAEDDRIYIGGVDGMISFRERELLDARSVESRFYFSSLSVNNRRVCPDDSHGILKEALPFIRSLDLAYNQNNISLTFANSDYVVLDKTTAWLYQLEGFDEDWIVTYQAGVNYTNLSPGTYTLRVREVGNKLGIADAKEISLIIRIHRPWFATWWAYTGYLMLIGGAAFYFWRIYRARRLLVLSLEKEKMEKEHMDEMNKMKLRFFTNISHEFRTPLTLIIGQIELLLQGELSSVMGKKLRSIHKNAMHLRLLITELLDFRKQEQGFLKLKVGHVDLVSFTKEVYFSFSELARSKQIDYVFDAADTQIEVWMDTGQMQKVLFNLLSNAFKYTPDKGRIRVEVCRQAEYVEISVLDTGCGIPEDSIPRIFERFYQVDDQTTTQVGSGIGLAFAKGIVDAHKGEIKVESAVGVGSCFRVRLLLGNRHFSMEEMESQVLPAGVEWMEELTDTETVLEEIPEALSETKEVSQPSVLLVEDDVEMREMLVNIFSPFYQVHTAADGREGFEKACELHPNLVVSDVMMPVMSGKELCYKIKNNLELAGVPVVLLTAQFSEEYTMEGYMFGADDYIAKPFNVKLLLTRCSNLLKNRRVLIERTVLTADKSKGGFCEKSGYSLSDQAMLEKAARIIRQNFDNPDFSMTMLASELGYGRNRMFARFKEAVGLTPNEFAMKIKLEEALRMLQEEPELNISEICYRLGFNSPRYFSRCFKEFYGVSPLNYRKKEDE